MRNEIGGYKLTENEAFFQCHINLGNPPKGGWCPIEKVASPEKEYQPRYLIIAIKIQKACPQLNFHHNTFEIPDKSN